MSYSCGVTGGQSFSVPRYLMFFPTSTYSGASVLAAPQSFLRVSGQQNIAVTLINPGTGARLFSWNFYLQGGLNSLSNGYIGYSYDPSANYTLELLPPGANCTITFAAPTPNTGYLNVFTITTSAPDSRVYTLQYSPFATVVPLIQCTTDNGGDPISAYNVEIKQTYWGFGCN